MAGRGELFATSTCTQYQDLHCLEQGSERVFHPRVCEWTRAGSCLILSPAAALVFWRCTRASQRKRRRYQCSPRHNNALQNILKHQTAVSLHQSEASGPNPGTCPGCARDFLRPRRLISLQRRSLISMRRRYSISSNTYLCTALTT